jgi:hypothetical protein
VIEKLPESISRILELRVAAEISQTNSAVLDQAVARQVEEFGPANLFADRIDLHRHQAAAWRSDMSFAQKYQKQIDRMAIVGDKQ